MSETGVQILSSAPLALAIESSTDNAISVSLQGGQEGRGQISSTFCSKIGPGLSKISDRSVVVGIRLSTYSNSSEVLEQSMRSYNSTHLQFSSSLSVLMEL